MGTTAEKLAYLAETKERIKTAIESKGVSIPDGTAFRQYADKIGEISGGGGIPNYIAPKNNVNGVYRPDNTATSFSLNGATDIDQYALARAFNNCTNLTTVDLSSLTTISRERAMYYCFYICTNLTTVDLSSLTTLSGTFAMNSCFRDCTSLTIIDLPSLTTISGERAMGYCFTNCTGLTTVNLSSLTTISGSGGMEYCFSSCRNLTSVNFQSLTTITGSSAMSNCFGGCSILNDVYFPALKTFGTSTSYFNNMLSSVYRCTLHFPVNMQSAIERMSGYPNFGGTNTIVLFDLPSTEEA